MNLQPSDAPALPVGIGGAVSSIRIPRAKRIVERVGGIGIPIAAVGIAHRIRIVRVRAQVAAIGPLLIIQPGCLGRVGVGSGPIAVRTAINSKLIRDAVGREGTAGAERIGDRVRIKFVGREVAEVFGVGGEREKHKETGEQVFHVAPLDLVGTLSYGEG